MNCFSLHSTENAAFPQIFSIADELIGGKPVITYGGGGGSDSDFRRDGRGPDEEENSYRRRRLMLAFKHIKSLGIRENILII